MYMSELQAFAMAKHKAVCWAYSEWPSMKGCKALRHAAAKYDVVFGCDSNCEVLGWSRVAQGDDIDRQEPCSNRRAGYLVAYHAIPLPAHKPLLTVFLMQRHNTSLDQGAGSEAVVNTEVATISIRCVFNSIQISQQTAAC
jgi:hypothetical protein